MSSTQEQRKRTEAGLCHDISGPKASKWLKLNTRLHSAAFYDSLSKVWLTRRALKELDRRKIKVNSLQRPASMPSQVTRKALEEIQRFARDGGPDLRDLRGYPEPGSVTHKMSSSYPPKGSQIRSTVPTNVALKIRKLPAYDKNFEQHLTDNHIYMDEPELEPGDLEEIRQRILRPRPSLSPSRFSNNAFKRFRQKNNRVINEGDVMRDVVPIMCGESDILSKQDLLFTELAPIANTIVDAKPDLYDGARSRDVEKKVREDIGDYIIPTGHAKAPVAPNFFLEVKGPSGAADVMRRQACYDGALGARAMHQLQSYKQEPIYDGSAYTITSTYHDGQLKIFTTHPRAGPEGSTEYYMFQIGGWSIVGDLETCRQGLTVFRNARDWAQEQRDAFILAANEIARPVILEPPVSESFGRNYASDPIDVESAGYLTTNEDSVDSPLYYKTNSNTPVTAHPEEYETSADELAFDTDAQPNKRRKMAFEKTLSEATGQGDSKTGRRESKR